MKKGMTVTYLVGNALYVNVTNKCTNRCDFCIRNNGDSAYGSDSLWLEREPTVDEICDSIFTHELNKLDELVFCGFGEPSMRLLDCRAVALRVKERCPALKVRINTNGHSDLILKTDSAPLYKDAFDVVSISLNSATSEGYDEICHPVYGKTAFAAILTFAQNVKNYVPIVAFSVVDEFLKPGELALAQQLADKAGIKLRVREYVSGN